VLVYLLGLLGIGVGVRFLRTRERERSRLWWGVAMVLWGAGGAAGGNELPGVQLCDQVRGPDHVCVDQLVGGVVSDPHHVQLQRPDAGRGPRRRRRDLAAGALVLLGGDGLLYVLVVLTGAFLPNRRLVSFELLVLFATPMVLALLALSARRYTRSASGADLAQVGTWLWLGVTVGAYYAYLSSGATERLWRQGVWFSENDVLHVGLILWVIYMARVVAPRLRDRPETPSSLR